MDSISCVKPVLQFTDLRVSTITTTADIGADIYRDTLFEQIQILPYAILKEGILKMDHGGKKKGTCFRDIMMKPSEKDTSFYNQTTVVIRKEVGPLLFKEINIKLFKNGGIQMTGVKTLEMASGALRWLLAHVSATCPGPLFSKPPVITKEATQLINTDFNIGSKIRRDVLQRILVDEYSLSSSYEASIYQGVKVRYFYNDSKSKSDPPGHCMCPKLCKGAGDGTKVGACKKITISSFQTGNVIVTGGRTMDQTEEAYEFIKRLFTKHQEEVLRKEYSLPESEESVKPKGKSEKTGWIKHPVPRNIVKFTQLKDA